MAQILLTQPIARTLRRLASTVMVFALVTACGEGASPQLSGPRAEHLGANVHLAETPSRMPIELHWNSALDGKERLSRLSVNVENTSMEPIEVTLYITSETGSRSIQPPSKNVHVPAKTSVEESIPVSALGIQLTGASVSTRIAAVYSGSDGEQRASALYPVWIEHEPGFDLARVRSGIVEARANAARGLAGLRDRRPGSARVWDSDTSRLAEVPVLEDRSLTSSFVVSHLPGLPDPAEVRAMNAVSDPSTPEEDDASAEVSAEQPSEAFDKGGNYTVCFKLPYWYFDADRGEDFLTGQSGGLSGYEPGRYMLAVLMNSSGQWIWAGNLSAAGCTTAVNHPNGTYSAWITTSLHRPASDVVIDVTNDESKTFDWGAQNYTISGAGGTINIWLVGSSSVSNGAAAAANSLFRSTTAYLSGARIDVFVDEPCPGSTPGDTSGCTIGSQIWLGPNNDGLSRAGFKVVVNHELGHAVQNDLFGPLDNTYTITTNEDLCRCDHVEASGNSHCLQSRHFSWAAQGEGWGHAFAASNLNNSAQNDCTFVYYKEFQNEDGSETQPPMPKSCFSQVRWMENHCQLGGHGTEWDWMNFFWRLRNRDTYSYANFASVYEDACGGTCSGDSTTWTTLQASAEDVFGEGAVKALAWENQGNNFGVNH